MFERISHKRVECPDCGEEVFTHVIKDGATYHVLSYRMSVNLDSSTKVTTVCSEPECEINHNCEGY